jgi:hypothetical protein
VSLTLLEYDAVNAAPPRACSQVAEHMLADTASGVSVRRSLDEVRRLHRGRTFDLVVAHFVLSELPTDAERDAAVSELWELVSRLTLRATHTHAHAHPASASAPSFVYVCACLLPGLRSTWGACW